MTYIDYMNFFWKIHQSEEFSSNEVYLYFFLLNECNIRGWQNPFEYPNRRIVLATGMSEKTVIEVRNRLQQKGLLRFEAGKRNAKSPVYYLPEESKKVSKNSSKKVSKTEGKEVSKTVSQYKIKDIKTKDYIPPKSPDGDYERNNNLQVEEEAFRILEEKLKKCEAALSIANSRINNDLEVETLSQLEAEFDTFRKAYPGTKRGLKTEFDNFKKKHKDYREVTPKLMPALEALKEWRTKAKEKGVFVPEYANLQTWINQRRWESEFEKFNEDGSTGMQNVNPGGVSKVGATAPKDYTKGF